MEVKDFLRRRAQDYRNVFVSVPGERVLADLAKFCRAHESCFAQDARAHAVAEGRREVWLRIQKNLHLTDEQIFALYGVNDNG